MMASRIVDESKVMPKSRSYSVLTDLLHEAGLIEKKQYQDLVDFNAHRNILSHNKFGIKKRKLVKREQSKNLKKC